MPRRSRLALLFVFLAMNLFGLACGSGGPDGPVAPGAELRVTVVNSSGETICFLSARETAIGVPWLDVLGGQLIPSGESQAVFLLDGEDNIWDIRVQDCDGAVLDEILGVDITNGFTWQFV